MPFWLEEQAKLFLIFITRFTLITLNNTLTVVPWTHKVLRKVLQITSILLIPQKINLSRFSVHSGFSNMYMTKNENPETSEIDRKLC